MRNTQMKAIIALDINRKNGRELGFVAFFYLIFTIETVHIVRSVPDESHPVRVRVVLSCHVLLQSTMVEAHFHVLIVLIQNGTSATVISANINSNFILSYWSVSTYCLICFRSDNHMWLTRIVLYTVFAENHSSHSDDTALKQQVFSVHVW